MSARDVHFESAAADPASATPPSAGSRAHAFPVSGPPYDAAAVADTHAGVFPDESTASPLSPPPLLPPVSPPDSPEPLQARPYRHQVGGHTALGRLRANSGAALISKPVSARERRFYETLLPPTLRPFVPACHGFGVVSLPAGANVDTPAALQSPPPARPAYLSGSGEPMVVNPWAAACLTRRLDAPAASPAPTAVPCILLEDLTAAMRRPCILDVKMGSRLHGPDATAAKRAKAAAKAAATTSARLGFRLCGMQVYDAAHDAFMCTNKYVGRSLAPDAVPEELARFFAAAPPGAPAAVAARLDQLRAAVADLDGFRFFSSSLLIVYDGAAGAALPQCDVRMIDFAHTAVHTNADGSETYIGPDESYLLGLTTLIAFLRDLPN